MRQKISPPRYVSPPLPEPPPKPATGWRRRVKWLRERSRSRVFWVAAGGFILWAMLFAYTAVRTSGTPLTPVDVKAVVVSALASATPPPSSASRVYGAVAPSLVEVKADRVDTSGKTQPDSGSGVIFDQTGMILTSLHVVKDATGIRVVFFDNTEAPAWIVSQDAASDIAVLRPEELPSQVVPATLGDPGSLHIGDEAIVIGNPFGIRGSVTDGVISGLGRNFKSPKTGQTLSNLIQFDAAVNPGNSGGPLLNRDGEVVGIVSSLLNPTDQDVFIGIGFAVPINTASSAAGGPVS
jgi:S1-C subfamily serine protease